MIETVDSLREAVLTEALAGLSSTPKTLPPWLFYDEAGSALFERITELPEYYLTRAERSIFAERAEEIINCVGHPLTIAELGSGTASKTGLLLAAAARRQPRLLYQPIDVSASALEQAANTLPMEIPGLVVRPQIANYITNGYTIERPDDGSILALYIGSSIGNFEPEEAIRLLCRVRARLRSGDGILLGVDLRKDERALLAAYNDSAGVTAAFNLNLLARLNRELGANFNPSLFAHRAVWNDEASRIEMHLECQASHIVRIPALDLEIAFAEGETIHTENSYKFPPGGAEAMLSAACFTPAATWTDPHSRFAVCLGQVE